MKSDVFPSDTMSRVDGSGSASPGEGLFEVKLPVATATSIVTSLPDPDQVNDGEGDGHSPGHCGERPMERAEQVGAGSGWPLRSSVPGHSAGVEKRIVEEYGNDAGRCVVELGGGCIWDLWFEGSNHLHLGFCLTISSGCSRSSQTSWLSIWRGLKIETLDVVRLADCEGTP